MTGPTSGARRFRTRSPSHDLEATALFGICCPSRGLFQNDRRRFTPASTTKLYTSWLACEALGEDHAFRSEYAFGGKTLYLDARSNPLLSEESFRPLLEDARGRRIEEIAIVRHEVPGLPYPSTWAIGDVREAWGAPVSGICFHENFGVADGGKGRVVAPSGSYFAVRRVASLRAPSVRGRVVSLPRGYKGTFEFPILDPEDFLFHWLQERTGRTLRRRRAVRLRGSPVPFAEASLPEVLRTMNKRSVNVIAELLLVHAAQALRKPLDYERPQVAYRAVLERIGVRDALLWDGSGVSRYNLVSPRGTVALLEAARKYPSIEASLPIGGKDGTLAQRRLPRRVHAKTGSLTGVQALAGYDGSDPFAIYINHGPAEEQVMIDAIDRIVMGS